VRLPAQPKSWAKFDERPDMIITDMIITDMIITDMIITDMSIT
jgi:hypothetical protein